MPRRRSLSFFNLRIGPGPGYLTPPKPRRVHLHKPRLLYARRPKFLRRKPIRRTLLNVWFLPPRRHH